MCPDPSKTLSKSQLLVIQYKALSYLYLSLNLKMFTLKETTEISSHSRGHTEVVAGPILGNGLFQDSTKTNHSHTHSHTHTLVEGGPPVPSFLPLMAGPRRRTGSSLPGSLSHLQGHSPTPPTPQLHLGLAHQDRCVH